MDDGIGLRSATGLSREAGGVVRLPGIVAAKAVAIATAQTADDGARLGEWERCVVGAVDFGGVIFAWISFNLV